MKLNRLGSSPLTVSELCLGSMTWGEQNTMAEAHAQLDYAFEHGINFIDTAEMYPVPTVAKTYGRTEEFIGPWLVKQQRDKIVLATKIAGPKRKLDWIRGGPSAIDAANIGEALHGSLKRLKTDYVDLYQLHWPERNVPMFGQTEFDPAQEKEDVPIRAQLEAMKRLIDAGKIRCVGLSNETPWGVMEFVRMAKEHGLPHVASIQNAYNLINRTFEMGLAEVAHRTEVPLIAYSPLAFGLLSGKYLAGPPATARLTLFPQFGQRYGKPNVTEAVAAYAELARRKGMSQATLALAFARSRWFVRSTIIGATSMAQLQENMASAGVALDADTLTEIQRIHLRYPNPAP